MAPWVRGGGEGMRLPGPQSRMRRSALPALALLCLTAPDGPGLRGQDRDLSAAWRSVFKREVDPPSPPDNPLTPNKVALGARLFSDARLSGADRSCASCHIPARAFSDGRRRPIDLSGRPLPRNTPSLFNLAWSKYYFWDGRAPSLEAQVAMPIEAGEEMRGDWPTILRRLGEDADLVERFRAAFPGEPSPSRATVLKALASYVRSLLSPPTRFDAWVNAEGGALSDAETRGLRLFVGKAACVLCHVGWRFTDDRFHDIGLRSRDAGRGGVKGGTPGLRAFKTPGLRELTRTAPYMHDGSLATLGAVIRHYNGGFVARPSLATQLNRGLSLSGRERADLLAFLRALSSPQGVGAPGTGGLKGEP
jgi:cytochrome c peroxidase